MGETARFRKVELEKFFTDVLPDSGDRREFSTGAVRDMAGKGRCDLLPWGIIGDLIFDKTEPGWDFCSRMDLATHGEEIKESIFGCLYSFDMITGSSTAALLLDVAHHYEAGAHKYSDRNWEKGIPIKVFLDSAGRHFLKYIDGWQDERHDRAVVWNLLGALWTIDHHPELVEAFYDF